MNVAQREARGLRPPSWYGCSDCAPGWRPDGLRTTCPLSCNRTLRAHQRSLDAERRLLLSRRAEWEAGRKRLADLQAWCRLVATNLRALTYQEKRDALMALGIGVRAWEQDHDPRYVITASIPLVDKAALNGQAGQDSMLYVASQKRSS